MFPNFTCPSIHVYIYPTREKFQYLNILDIISNANFFNWIFLNILLSYSINLILKPALVVIISLFISKLLEKFSSDAYCVNYNFFILINSTETSLLKVCDDLLMVSGWPLTILCHLIGLRAGISGSALNSFSTYLSGRNLFVSLSSPLTLFF